eukprot:TRINITY_DN1857_c0_g1_i1.p1 TRINITY_DN1857_c0_g1~~TRINITY_DN1857_c0_g1_i1.p1  ORF type:complete len:380 (+),score=121.78 TRINITY_DN1857_c0_g1_i1:143-1282(+)
MRTSKAIFAAVAVLIPVVYCALLWNEIEDSPAVSHLSRQWLAVLAASSVAAFLATLYFVPLVVPLCLGAGLAGKDINKPVKYQVPEALGIVPATITLITVISFQWLFVESLSLYNAALTSLCLILFLGFADDVLEVRWSVKLLLSFLGAFPLIMAYDGPTNIIVPKPLRDYFGFDITLGVFYLVYMELLAVFCTNSINILAGINGLETGQSVVLALEILVHNFVEISADHSTDYHVLSMFIMLPFLMSSCALFYYNWFPSEVFVGDSYTYFAGMAFAVVGILGHFSKTLMIFFTPQIINFVLSLPQLFGFLPCPRHRLPKLNTKTGKLHYSPNQTLINAWLYVFGEMSENMLCAQLLAFQVLCGVGAFWVRYSLAAYFY